MFQKPSETFFPLNLGLELRSKQVVRISQELKVSLIVPMTFSVVN
jgi:hypothetical protein